MSYDPFDWYWVSDDGRIFASARRAIVPAADAGLAFRAAGATPTRWPVDDAGHQTDAALQAVLTPYGIQVGLAALQAVLCDDIDDQAEAQRAKYITTGSGQAMIYLQKQSQAVAALAGLAATPPMTAADGAARFILLAAEVGITIDPSTNAPATDVFGVARQVAATVQAWLSVGAAIEKARLQTKAAVAAATTVAAAQAAHDAIVWPGA